MTIQSAETAVVWWKGLEQSSATCWDPLTPVPPPAAAAQGLSRAEVATKPKDAIFTSESGNNPV